MMIIIYIFIYIIYNIYKYINNKIQFRFFIGKFLTATTATQQGNGGMGENKTVICHNCHTLIKKSAKSIRYSKNIRTFVTDMQQNRTITPIVTVWLLMLMPMMGRSQETGARSQEYELRKENDSLYWLGVKGGSKSDEWRLAHPVYQFQTGDVDGDGSEDAMVGVIKKTRYYPMGKRLFIFKQIDGYGGAGVRGRDGARIPRKLVRPMWLGSKLGGILEDFRFVEPAEGDSMGRIRALESTTDSLYVVSDYKWSGFGMKFERFIIKGVDKETALRHFGH